MKNHEKPWKTMKNQPGTMKKQKTMKNHEKPTWNHEKPTWNHEKPWKTNLEPLKTMKNNWPLRWGRRWGVAGMTEKRDLRGVTTDLLDV